MTQQLQINIQNETPALSRALTSVRRPTSVEGLSIAYLVMIHNEDTIKGFEELYEVLDHPDDQFFVHADLVGINETFPALKNRWKDVHNVKLVEPRYKGTWARFDQIDVSLATLETAVRSPKPWKTAIFTDGAAFPLKKPSYWREYVASLPVNASYFGPYDPACNYDTTARQLKGKCFRSPARCTDQNCTKMTHTPLEAVVVPSINWVMLPYGLGKYIVDPKIKKAFSDFFRHTVYPDESFWATIFWSSPWKDHSIKERWLYTRWNVPCKSYVNHKSHNSPCFLGLNDIDELLGAPYWFARKFYPGDPMKEVLKQKWSKEPDHRLISFSDYLNYTSTMLEKAMQTMRDRSESVFEWKKRHAFKADRVARDYAYYRFESVNVAVNGSQEWPFRWTETIKPRDQWQIQREEGGYKLRNQGSGQYLAVVDGHLVEKPQWALTENSLKELLWNFEPFEVISPNTMVFGRFWTINHVASDLTLECQNCTAVYKVQKKTVSPFNPENLEQVFRVVPVKAWQTS